MGKHDAASGGKSGGTMAKRPAFKRTLSVVTGKVLGTAPELYSPTHFAHGLFSPAAANKDYDIEYNTRNPVLPPSFAPAAGPISPLSPSSLQNFFPMVDDLPSLPFSEKEF